MKNHLIIAGTGRAGTSLLVRYLTECGLETHITRDGATQWDDHANAGLEDAPFPGIDCPYVIKWPWLFEHVDALVQRQDITVDAVIMPVRDLVEAATSRSILELRARHSDVPFMDQMKTWETWAYTPGGTIYSVNPIDQARILALGFYKTIHTLVRHGIKIIFLDFPRFVEDADYLYDKLIDFLPNSLEKDAALEAHARVAELSKVRTKTEISEFYDQTAPGRYSKIFKPGIEYPSFDAVDYIALKRALSTIRNLLEECSLQRENLIIERDALVVERDALISARHALATEHDAVAKKLSAMKKVLLVRFVPNRIKRILTHLLMGNQ